MTIDTYGELLAHVGHEIKCVTYGFPGAPDNVAIECETCGMVLLDYDRPSRFIVVGKFQDNPSGDYLKLVPITIPAADMIEGTISAMRVIDDKLGARHERWRMLTVAQEPIYFPETFTGFEALWALASNPEVYNGIITIVTNLAEHLGNLADEELTIDEGDEPVVATFLHELRDAVDALKP